MRCIRVNCKNQAIVDSVFGVLPCASCQKKDEAFSFRKPPEFYSIGKMDRFQRQRDRHLKDMVQPYERGKINPDFFKAYPERVDDYNAGEELKRV